MQYDNLTLGIPKIDATASRGMSGSHFSSDSTDKATPAPIRDVHVH